MKIESRGRSLRFGTCVSSSDARTTVVESTMRDGTMKLKNVRRDGTPPTAMKVGGVAVMPFTTIVKSLSGPERKVWFVGVFEIGLMMSGVTAVSGDTLSRSVTGLDDCT